MSIDPEAPIADQRRHDLDALRAFAMILGISLHASLSFFPAPWPAQDSRQDEFFGLFMAIVHGFRMQLFFLISGYFTMMLYRKRGLNSLLRQRGLRILLPCLLGLGTVVPLTHLASGWAIRTASSSLKGDDKTLVAAIRAGDKRAIEGFLDKNAEINLPDPKLGITPIAWAAMKGDVASVTLLIDRGADVNRGNRDGSTALHGAAFLGHENVAEILIERGADPKIRNNGGDHAIQATYADWGVTTYILDLVGLPRPERSRLEEGRNRVRRMLEGLVSPDPNSTDSPSNHAIETPRGPFQVYRSFLNSDLFLIKSPSWSFHLINSPVFDHLWFLWFLCWFVVLFSLTVWGTSRLAIRTRSMGVGRLLWLVPMTLIPQWFMGSPTPQLGPDTFTGVIPPPHLLLYYSLFFGFGAFYFDSNDVRGRLGRGWWALLPAGLFVAFPLSLGSLSHRTLTSVAQVIYAWSMSFGMMGLFQACLKKENRPIRYLSDSAYWLYLTHLPLVIFAQAIVRDWSLPATVKFAMICVIVTGVLLVIYQALVRYSWLGALLNGRQRRPSRNIVNL